MERQKIVAVGDGDGSILQELEELFARSAVDVQTIEDSANALSLIATLPIDLVLIEHPLREGSVAELASEISRSACGDPKIVVLSEAAAVEELLVRVGRRWPVIGREAGSGFQERVAAHLQKWPTQPRLMVRLQVTLGAGGFDRLAQTQNLSETGVLIHTRHRLPLGSDVNLEISLPAAGRRFKVGGKVARYTDPAKEGIEGMGIAFHPLSPEVAEPLHQFLERSLGRGTD